MLVFVALLVGPPGLVGGRFLSAKGVPTGGGVKAPAFPNDPVLTATTRALVVMVGFPDQRAGKLSVSQAQNTYFGPSRSVASYLDGQSAGAFKLTGDVVGGEAANQTSTDVILPNPTSVYGAMGRQKGEMAMAKDAVALLGAAGFNWHPYEDAKGHISQLVFLFSVPGNFDHSSPFYYGWTYWDGGLQTTSAGIPVWNESFVSQSDALGSFAHEFGHMLGFRDTYNQDLSNAANGCIEGAWDLYDIGNFDGNGDQPAPIDPYQKMTVGWLRPTLISAPGRYQLPAVETSGKVDAIAFPRAHEMYLLENIESLGNDAALPGKGLLIWRVDTALANPQGSAWANDQVNDWGSGANAHPGISLVSAGGLSLGRTCGSEADPFPGSRGVLSFTDGTQPSAALFDGQESGLAITGIRVEGGVVSFRATFQTPASIPRPGSLTSGMVLSSKGALPKIRPLAPPGGGL